MGLFDILKNVFSNSTNTKKTNYVQPTKSNYIPTYHIEDWQPKLKYPEYDKLFSLQKYLESIDLPKTTISKVMKSSNPFGEAKNLFNGLNEKVEWSDMCWKEAQRMERWIKVLSLWEAPPERIIESTFMYLLLRLGWLCHWDASKQKALNDTGLFYLLEECKQNDYARLLKAVDADIISCFALAHIRSGKNLTQIVAEGFNYLDMNTTHNGSAHGSFYNLFGKRQLKGLIGKIIESAYIQNKFSLKRLFFKEEKYEKTTTTYKYDFSKMHKHNMIYVPTEEMKEMLISDVLYLNDFFAQAHEITKKIPNYQLQPKDISLFFGRPIQSEYQFCHFTFTPNTPTGKAAKYPYTMFFNCKNGNITFTGKIEYLSNNAMGKISITIFDSKNTFEIAVAVKNSSLQITRIGQAIFNKQYMTDIFNINKQ
jgi:hypothetical protein